MAPAHVPNTGRSLRANSARGSISPDRSAIIDIVVDSPPGNTSRSMSASCSGVRTSTTVAPMSREGASVEPERPL